MSRRSNAAALVSPRADGSRRRVLYAEDQISSRTVTKAMLERMGFIVDAVEDGDVAVQRARNDNYDVILLDIEMPVMDGVTAARSIRSEAHSIVNTPILALSAFLADSTENSAWRDAFDSALPKPANGNELFKAMQSAVSNKDALMRKAFPDTALLVKELKAHLPQVMWKELSAETYNKMHHLANAQVAAFEAGDAKLCDEIAARLEDLTKRFGAMLVAELANGEEDEALRFAVSNWVMH